jgi:hypothetical protein
MASVPISVLAFVRPVSFNAGWTEVHRGTIPVCLLLGAASVARKSDRAKVDVVALIVVLTVLVCLLTILVAGLLRSHADILRALHSLGAGVGDPTSGDEAQSAPISLSPSAPPLPGERNSVGVFDLSGATPSGDAIALAVAGADQLTLIAFLSSGCTSCAGIWKAMVRSHGDLPHDVRLVVATKGPELESPPEVGAKAAGGSFPVVMSTAAWGDYEVPGAPFFVLVDGRRSRRIGEGIANTFPQVLDLVRRAQREIPESDESNHSRAFALGLDGPERESANDEELIRAGIHPGDPSLYPQSHDDVFGVGKVPAPNDGA